MKKKVKYKHREIKEKIILILKKNNKDYIYLSFEKSFQYQNFDSIDYLNFILKIQSIFKIKINNKELNKIKSLNNLITLISRKL